MFQSKEISALKEQNTTLESQLNAEKAAKTAAFTELTDLKASLETVKIEAAKIPGLEAKISEQEAALAAEKARADKAAADLAAANAAADTKIEAEVVSRLAAAGVEPVKRDPKAKAENAKTRAEFNAMGAHEKAQFLRAGGKLTD